MKEVKDKRGEGWRGNEHPDKIEAKGWAMKERENQAV